MLNINTPRTHIKQRDLTDCGAACLASVAAHHHLEVPVARIRQLASTDTKGTHVLGMVQAAMALGLDAKGVRGPFESLSTIPLPAIAHIVVRNVIQHYVVIYKVTQDYIAVMDPATGTIEKLSPETFRKQWTGVLIILWPNESFKPGNQKRSLTKTLWGLIRPHRSTVLQAFFGSVVYTLIGLSMSVYVQVIIDDVFIHEDRNLLNLLSGFMLTLLLIQVFIQVARSILTIRTGQAIDRQLILGYYQHLLKLPQAFFDSMRSGEILSRINDAVKIRMFINEAMLNLSVNFLVVLLSFSLMFIYNWRLSLLMLVIIPLYSIVYLISSRFNRTVERRAMEQAADLESQLVESIQAIRTIKSYGLEGTAYSKTADSFERLLSTLYRSGQNAIFTISSTELLSRLFTILLFWAGSTYVIQKELTPGELLSFYALIGYFTGPATSLIGMNKVIQNAIIAADRLFDILDLEQETRVTGIVLEPPLTGDIIFDHVSFGYGSNAAVLNDLCIRIPAGRITAVVGESGSGKSTLIALLQNLYTPSGTITLGDYSICHIENHSLRRFVGVVPQKIDLFAGNVTENIAPGDDEPDLKRITHLCISLGILEFIEKLPQGFNTYLGENGITLSGGQKQRLAIARALYREPEILILDEATSSLDPVAEQYIQRVIRSYRDRGKTIILIAHRLSSVRDADKIIVLDSGRVAEEGTHTELLSYKGKYHQLLQYQLPNVDFASSNPVNN